MTRFWISARGFWGKSGDRLAWAFTIGLLLLIVGHVGFQYGINVWNRAIFDAIEKRDSATVYYLAAVFFPLAIGSVLLGVAQVFGRMGIQRRWRAWLTNSVISRWLAHGRYYQLNLVGGMIWERCDGTRTRQQIAFELAGEFAVEQAELEDDVNQFVADLVKRGWLLDD